MRRTGVIPAVAVLVFAGAVVSELLAGRFWSRHTLLANLVSSLIVVVLSVAVVNEVLERRQRQRWSVLAQYVLFELARTARLSWTGMAELIGVISAGEETEKTLAVAAQTVRDTPRLATAMRGALADPDRRSRVHRLLQLMTDRSDEVIGRWASVMLNSNAYAEIIDRHVELYSRVAWVGSLLDHLEPRDDDPRRRRLSRSSPAVQLQNDFDDDQLSDHLVTIAQLAESLDRGTLTLALRIVPQEWWTSRMQSGAVAPDADDEAG